MMHTTTTRVRRLAAAAATVAAAIGGAHGTRAQQAAPSYAISTQTVFIPFVGLPPDSVLRWTDPVHVSFSVGRGRRRRVTMDTGSTGVMIAAPLIPRYRPPASVDTGWEYLSSSKLLFKGHWVRQDLVFYDLAGAPLATANVPVLAVDSVIDCPDMDKATGVCRDPRNARRDRGTVYMGVGFGREYNGQPQGTPDKNPFLNLTRIGQRRVTRSGVHAGYIITAGGVHLGLTAAHSRGFVYQHLASYSRLPMDWAEPGACLQVDASACVAGKALVDTGVDQMYLTVTDAIPVHTFQPPQGPAILANGSCVTVQFPVTGSSVSYTFTVGVPNLTAPRVAIPSILDVAATFVNTGRHFLRGFDVLFDAEDGWFGLRSVASTGAAASPQPCSRQR